MQAYTRVLVKVNVDKLKDNFNLSTFGAKSKISTGYLFSSAGTVAIPLRFLLRDGFSFDYLPDWYEKGSIIVNNEPCYIFSNTEVDILSEG